MKIATTKSTLKAITIEITAITVAPRGVCKIFRWLTYKYTKNLNILELEDASSDGVGTIK